MIKGRKTNQQQLLTKTENSPALPNEAPTAPKKREVPGFLQSKKREPLALPEPKRVQSMEPQLRGLSLQAPKRLSGQIGVTE